MKKVNIYLDDVLWRAFRITCLEQKISASQQIGVLITQFLQGQEHQEEKSTDASAVSVCDSN